MGPVETAVSRYRKVGGRRDWTDAVAIVLTEKAERRISLDAVNFLGIGERADRDPVSWGVRAICQASYLPFRQVALVDSECVTFFESNEDQSEWVVAIVPLPGYGDKMSERTIRWLADRSDFEFREGQATKPRGPESNFLLLCLVAILAFNRPNSGRTVDPWDRGSFSRKVPKLRTDLKGPILDCVVDIDLDKWDFDKRIRPTLFNGGGAGKMQHKVKGYWRPWRKGGPLNIWVPPHVRGNPALGIKRKSYNIDASRIGD